MLPEQWIREMPVELVKVRAQSPSQERPKTGCTDDYDDYDDYLMITDDYVDSGTTQVLSGTAEPDTGLQTESVWFGA